MKEIQLGEVALTESSLKDAFEAIVDKLYPTERILEGDRIYKIMEEEAILTVDRRLYFNAMRASENIPVQTDHFMLGKAKWMLSLGGYVAWAIDPLR